MELPISKTKPKSLLMSSILIKGWAKPPDQAAFNEASLVSIIHIQDRKDPKMWGTAA